MSTAIKGSPVRVQKSERWSSPYHFLPQLILSHREGYTGQTQERTEVVCIYSKQALAYRTPHLLEIQAVDHSRELTYFFSSQVVALLLLIGFLIFKLKNGFNIKNW